MPAADADSKAPDRRDEEIRRLNLKIRRLALSGIEHKANAYKYAALAQKPSLSVTCDEQQIISLVQGSHLFDAAFYLAKNPDVKNANIDALSHYLSHGDKEGRAPHPLFDVHFYKESNADIDWHQTNSLVHYLLAGWHQERRPHILFDPEFYVAHSSFDCTANISPLQHYVETGAAANACPHPLFDSKFYCSQLEVHPENPLIHFLENGHYRLTSPHCLFQSWFYAQNASDLKACENPLIHYLLLGARELKNPNVLFDAVYYAQHTPGVFQYEPDALQHYIKSGSNLSPNKKFDPTVYKADEQNPLADFLQKHSYKNQTSTLANQHYDSENPVVSIVIVNLSRCGLVADCLQSIWKRTTDYKYEIIVIDCGSGETDIAYLENLRGPFCLVKLTENIGFGASNNMGAKIAKGKYLVLLNSDTLVTTNWLPPLIKPLLMPHIGATGAKLVYPDGRLQEAGASVNSRGESHRFGHGENASLPQWNKSKDVMYVSAATTAFRLEDFLSLGGFDDFYNPAYSEDIDLCLRVRKAGMRVVYCPESTVIHYEGATSQTSNPDVLKNLWQRNKKYFTDRWSAAIQAGEFEPATNYHVKEFAK